MTIAKSHYYRKRLLRDRIRSDERSHRLHSDSSIPSPAANEEDNFRLPDYFEDAARASSQVLAPSPVVILWDEAA